MSEAKNDTCPIVRQTEKRTTSSPTWQSAAIVIRFRDEDDWFNYRGRACRSVRLNPFALSLSKGERTAREKDSTVIIIKAF